LNETVVLYILIALSLLLPRIPVIGIFFRIVNTMLHESGHALAALLTSGEVLRLDLQHDTSGSALTRSSSWVSRFLTALAGYPVSSVSAWLLFYLVKLERFDWLLFALFSVALINLLLWVRNWFGIVWLIVFMLLTGAVFFYAPPFYHKALAIFCAGVVLFDSVASAFIIFVLSIKSPKQAGDAKNLADATHIPAFFWGLLFLAQALWFAYLVADMFFGVHEFVKSLL
jgi:hypothetical protein